MLGLMIAIREPGGVIHCILWFSPRPTEAVLEEHRPRPSQFPVPGAAIDEVGVPRGWGQGLVGMVELAPVGERGP